MPTTVQPRIVATTSRRGVSFPLTTGLLSVVLAVGAATGALWDGDAARALVAEQGYGLPALEAGRWWTLLSGSLLVPDLRTHVAAAVAVVVLGGFAERRLGAARALGVVVACQLAGVLAAAAALAWVSPSGWDWAASVARDLDLGPFPGLFGAAAVATAGLSLPWRGRLRVALVGWVTLALLYAGGLAQLEHAAAVVVGLAVGPLCFARRPSLRPRSLTRRDHRRLGSGFLAVSGVAAIVSSISPVSGPLAGSEPSVRVLAVHAGHGLPGGALLHGVAFIVLARAVHRGSRRGWWLAVALTAAVTAGQLAVTAALLAADRSCWPALVDNAALNVVGLGVLLAGHRACAVPSRRRSTLLRGSLLRPADAAERDAAVRCLTTGGASNRLAWMTTWPENRWFTGAGLSGYVAHRVHAGVALGVGDPVGQGAAAQTDLIEGFARQARRDGLVPCLFAATEQTRQAAHLLGWSSLQVAEEAVIDLRTLDFRGRAWQDVRTALNQAAKRGLDFHLGPLASMPARWRGQVETISTQWVQDKGLPELGFTLGGVEEALDPRVRVGIAVDAAGVVHGVTSWMPVHRPGDGRLEGWTLDVMRRRPDGFRGVMEFLIARACLDFRAEGATVVSLSAAPLARTTSDGPRRPVEIFLDRLGAELEPLYGFRSLQGFKAKFQPRFEPLHLLYPDEAALPRIGVALTRAYLPSTGWIELAGLVRHGGAHRTPTVHDSVGASTPVA
jgi:lysylphosphatidylglycerol synthetase-like protein (DUF2156 family)